MSPSDLRTPDGAPRRRGGARVAGAPRHRGCRARQARGRGGARRTSAPNVRSTRILRAGSPRRCAWASPPCRPTSPGRSSCSATCRRSTPALIDRLIEAFEGRPDALAVAPLQAAGAAILSSSAARLFGARDATRRRRRRAPAARRAYPPMRSRRNRSWRRATPRSTSTRPRIWRGGVRPGANDWRRFEFVADIMKFS